MAAHHADSTGVGEARPSPENIGRYRILGELGSGSMGRVYLAHDPNIGREIAIKVLLPSTWMRSQAESVLRERFVLEARAAGRLNHPGIVAIYDADIDPANEVAFIAMEAVEGVSLQQFLRSRRRPLPVATACEIARQVARALDYAHTRGVVHRDVKPANILLSSDGPVKVADFGIAKILAEGQTLTGQLMGTPAYMSPEQVQGETVDGRSDLFSLGTVLYESLAGEKPFTGETVATIVHRITSYDPPRPVGVDGEIPARLWATVSVLIEKDRNKRLPTGRELARQLEAFVPDDRSGFMLGELELSQAALERSSTELLVRSSVGGIDLPDPAAASAREQRRGSPGRAHLLGWAVPLVALGLLLAALIPRAPGSEPGVVARRLDPLAATSVPDAGSAPVAEPPLTTEPPPAADRAPGTEPAPARGDATLVVLHENRLKSAHLTIWVDGKKIWTRSIVAKGSFVSRARGQLVRATVPITPGRHTIEISVTGVKGKVDAAHTATGRFDAGETRYLRATLIPVVDRLELRWQP